MAELRREFIYNVAWMKRYSSISMDEINGFEAREFGWYCDSLSDIIKKENPEK